MEDSSLEGRKDGVFLRKKEQLYIDAEAGAPGTIVHEEPGDKQERLNEIEPDPEKRKNRFYRLKHDVTTGPGSPDGLRTILRNIKHDLQRVENLYTEILDQPEGWQKWRGVLFKSMLHVNEVRDLMTRWKKDYERAQKHGSPVMLDGEKYYIKETESRAKLSDEKEETGRPIEVNINFPHPHFDETMELLRDRELRSLFEEIVEKDRAEGDDVATTRLDGDREPEEAQEMAQKALNELGNSGLGVVEPIYSSKPVLGFNVTEKGNDVHSMLKSMKATWDKYAHTVLKKMFPGGVMKGRGKALRIEEKPSND